MTRRHITAVAANMLHTAAGSDSMTGMSCTSIWRAAMSTALFAESCNRRSLSTDKDYAELEGMLLLGNAVFCCSAPQMVFHDRLKWWMSQCGHSCRAICLELASVGWLNRLSLGFYCSS